MSDTVSHTNAAASEFLNRTMAHLVAAALIGGSSYWVGQSFHHPQIPPLPPIETCAKLMQDLNIFRAHEER
jgi:hypothetical protein